MKVFFFPALTWNQGLVRAELAPLPAPDGFYKQRVGQFGDLGLGCTERSGGDSDRGGVSTSQAGREVSLERNLMSLQLGEDFV